MLVSINEYFCSWLENFSLSKSNKNNYLKKKKKEDKREYALPYLDTRVHVIVDVVIFQHTVPVVVEIYTNLK